MNKINEYARVAFQYCKESMTQDDIAKKIGCKVSPIYEPVIVKDAKLRNSIINDPFYNVQLL